jgi:excinuclease ABC subunit A
MQAAKTKEEVIAIRGARVHNLKNISCSIPNGKLTVITGVSGSGKSSLAFDTIYAEGQRRYVESLSAYARQFLERIDKPLVDEITGISPAIAIRQKNSTRNPRSTVATQTEIYDYLRLLFARIGRTFCYKCGEEVLKDTPESSADEVLAALPEGARFLVLFPATVFFNPKAKKQNKTAVLMTLLGHGFSRLYRTGEIIDLQKPEDFEYEDLEDTMVLVDRLKASDKVRQRLVDSLETCFRESRSAVVIAADAEAGREMRFSEAFVCRNDGTEYDEPEPRLFSFNSPFGACPTCQGFGNTTGIDYGLVVPDDSLSLKKHAIEPFSTPKHKWAYDELIQFAQSEGIPTDVPFADLTDDQQKAILKGKDSWRGVRGFFEWKERKKYKLHVRVFLAKYRGYTICPDCDGGRLRIESRSVKIGGKCLPEAVASRRRSARNCLTRSAGGSVSWSMSGLNISLSTVLRRLCREARRRGYNWLPTSARCSLGRYTCWTSRA